jgi:hypothetical protein
VSHAQGNAAWLTSSTARVNTQHQGFFSTVGVIFGKNVIDECLIPLKKSAYQVALLVKGEIDLYRLAFREEMLQ